MIPADLAARLRLLTESAVNPVSPVRGIPADLPELPLGQRFTARIESALPDGTFRALVAGRSLTLALPQPARPGDTLELVVTARTPQLILAEGADEAAAGRAPATLSRAGQLLGSLLAGETSAPRPALVGSTAPLLPAPQMQADALTPALRQAIVESGLFYESHQAQWIAGRYSAQALAREPQARQAARPPAGRAAAPPPMTEEARASEQPPNTPAAAGRGIAAGMPSMPAELQAIVLQQLDAAATQHLVWRGELWPGQGLHWEIVAEEGKREAPHEAPAAQWTTRLRLTLPRLGEVDASLTLAPEKVSLAMTANADAADTLRRGLGELAAAFSAAGLPPLAAGVGTHEPA